jgi:hypothetical protein
LGWQTRAWYRREKSFVATNQQGHHIAMKLTKVMAFRAVQVTGFEHETIKTCSYPCCVLLEAFAWINMMICNVKNSIHRPYHAIDEKQLPLYLAEFWYRFNRCSKTLEYDSSTWLCSYQIAIHVIQTIKVWQRFVGNQVTLLRHNASTYRNLLFMDVVMDVLRTYVATCFLCLRVTNRNDNF